MALCLSTVAIGGAMAQGSAGGSIGNDDKSVSGSLPERAIAPDKPAAPERRGERGRQLREPAARGTRRQQRQPGWDVDHLQRRRELPGQIFGNGGRPRRTHRRRARKCHDRSRRIGERVGQLRWHHGDQPGPHGGPQRLRNVPAVRRLLRAVDLVEAMMCPMTSRIENPFRKRSFGSSARSAVTPTTLYGLAFTRALAAVSRS